MENQLISKNEDFQLVQLLEKYLSHWQWFVLSVMVCCMFAVIYVKSTPKLYLRTASVLIKEEDKDISAAFSGGNSPYRNMTNVNNEIEAFKSQILMQEVVSSLRMNVGYVTKEGLRKVDLYTQSPITAVFPTSHESESFVFRVELLANDEIVLSRFVQGENKIKQSINTRFNEVTKTPVGDIIISPSLYYSGERNYNPIEVSKGDVKSVALRLSRRVNVHLSDKLNTVISLEIEDVSIQRAEDILTTLINVYKENWVTEKNRAAITTLSFLDERIPMVEEELTEIDGRVVLFKSRNLVTDVRNVASLQMSQSMEYAGRIQEISSQISIVQFIQEYLNDNSKIFELLPTTTGVNNPALEISVNQYNTLLSNRNRLVANSSELNPMIIERNRELQALRQSIINTVDNLITSLNLELSSLQSQEARMTRSIASNPSQERFLMAVEREKEIKENLYRYLLQQREENEMALVVTATNLQIISPPLGSNIPVKPSKFQILLIAMIIGCAIPGGIILAYDFLNVAIRDKRDLAALPVPLLGVIPEVKIEEDKKMLMIQDHGRGAINESFRILRTNLRFACSKDTKVIQITSLDPNAGKTFIALNLAMSFAVTGKKVALLDLDLRMATLSNLVGNPEKGIANMLSETTVRDKSPVIKKDYFYHGFDIIPAGSEPSNPAELLMGDGLAKLIEKLKALYDYVFIDSPPIHPVVDAILVAQHADISIFVVREKVTDRRRLPDIKYIFHEGKFKDMHLVLNGVVAEIKTNRYNEYYN